MLKPINDTKIADAKEIISEFNDGPIARKLDRPHMRHYLQAVGLREIDFRGNRVLAAFHLGIALGSAMSAEIEEVTIRRGPGRPRKNAI